MAFESTIASRRQRALLFVRATALILGLLGSIILLYAAGLVIVMRDINAIWTLWGDTSWFAWGIAFFMPAVMLFLFDRRIVRWLIPIPRRECPECGYPLRGLSASSLRCPECGTAIGDRSGASGFDAGARK